MTFDEAKEILNIFGFTYPHYYKDLTKEQKLGLVGLWAEIFKDVPASTVVKAVKDHIKVSKDKFPPMPGEIAERLVAAGRKPFEEQAREAWEVIKDYMGGMNWDTSDVDRYYRLPDEIQKFYSYAALKEMAMGKSRENEMYEKPRFLKAFADMLKEDEHRKISQGKMSDLLEHSDAKKIGHDDEGDDEDNDDE